MFCWNRNKRSRSSMTHRPLRGTGSPSRIHFPVPLPGSTSAHDALAPRLEEVLQQPRRLALADAAIDLGRVMAGRLVEEPDSVLDGASLGVMGREIDPPDASERDRGRAHGAGFEGHIEVAARQALIVKRLAGL